MQKWTTEKLFISAKKYSSLKKWRLSEPSAYVTASAKGILKNGGEGGIRTHGTLARSPVFKTVALDYSSDFTELLNLKMSKYVSL